VLLDHPQHVLAAALAHDDGLVLAGRERHRVGLHELWNIDRSGMTIAPSWVGTSNLVVLTDTVPEKAAAPLPVRANRSARWPS
jgi:hypothetical protein